MFKHIFLVVGIFVLIASAIALFWSVLPLKMVSATQVLQPEAMSLNIKGRQEWWVPSHTRFCWSGLVDCA
jgi:hypothetical protein